MFSEFQCLTYDDKTRKGKMCDLDPTQLNLATTFVHMVGQIFFLDVFISGSLVNIYFFLLTHKIHKRRDQSFVFALQNLICFCIFGAKLSAKFIAETMNIWWILIEWIQGRINDKSNKNYINVGRIGDFTNTTEDGEKNISI